MSAENKTKGQVEIGKNNFCDFEVKFGWVVEKLIEIGKDNFVILK